MTPEALLRIESSPSSTSPRPLGAASTQAVFREQLATLMAPALQEVVSERTEGFQRQLLGAASLLILLRFSLVGVTGDAEFLGFKVDAVAGTAFLIALAATLYLEVLTLVRTRLDWNAWKIRVGAAEAYLHALERVTRASPSASGSNAYEEANDRHVDRSARDYPEMWNSPEEIKADQEKEHAQAVLETELTGYLIWVRQRVTPLRRLNSSRAIVEVLFPVLYGAVALLLAIPGLR